MMGTLAPRERRLVALAILIGLISALWIGLVAPVLSIQREHGEHKSKQEKLLAGYRRIAATKPALEAQLRELKAREAGEAGFLEGGTASLSAAKLQSDLKQLVEASGGEVKSTLNLSPQDTGDFRRIPIRIDFRATVSGLQKIVYEIETLTPKLFIDKLYVRGPSFEGLVETATKEPRLTIVCEIYGYLRGSGQ